MKVLLYPAPSKFGQKEPRDKIITHNTSFLLRNFCTFLIASGCTQVLQEDK